MSNDELQNALCLLKDSEERFRALADNIPNLAWMANADGWIYWYNKQWYDYTGTTPEAMQGWGWQKVHHPDYVKAVTEEWTSSIKSGKPYDNMFPLRGKDGNYRWFLTRVVPIRDEQGKIIHWFGTNTDITERKQTEEALMASEKLLASDLSAMKILQDVSARSVQEGDLGSLLDDIMEAAIIITGADRGTLQLTRPKSGALEIVSQRGFEPSYINFFTSVSHGMAAAWAKAFEHGERVVVDDVTRSPIFIGTPSMYVQLNAGVRAVQSTPLVNRKGQTICMISTHWSHPHRPDERSLRYIDLLARQAADVIERKRAEEQLNEAKRQAELYVDLMGHDINNINQAAIGFLELALMTLETEKMLKPEDKPLIEKPLTVLEGSTRLIENVRKIQQLLNEGVKTKPLDIGEILDEIDIERLKQDGRDITINIPSISRYFVDANELLGDVLLNLITNAIKHSGDDRPLIVNVMVNPFESQGKEYYRCIVEDNGPGIPDDLKGRLFNRFQRGATRAHGKGLGLYLVRMLVESFRGKVWVEDRVPGDYTKGARFVVMLPALDP